jgi:hypothetical protein
MTIISLIQKVAIEEKLKSAPDSGYQTGIIIGSFIPFVVLVGLAYWMYYKSKKRNEEDNY